MIKLKKKGAYLIKGRIIRDSLKDLKSINKELEKANQSPLSDTNLDGLNPEVARNNTMAYQILIDHDTGSGDETLNIKFDAMASHDITYVGIIQTAKASGLKEFPLPYVLTNCHNSLCAVGGTINEDDHVFGLTAARKFGGYYVPAHLAVIHQYMREMMTGCGKMILGSDSHTRYGALGTMGIGEGGPELVKQLLNRTYDIPRPEVICVYLTGKPRKGVGPQDVALAIIGEVFSSGFVKNKVMEFVGPGIEELSIDYRNGIDVMTTETSCLSSIWSTDDRVREYYKIHGRENEYQELKPGEVAYYDGFIIVDLSKIEPMIALPFHPSNVYKISELNNNPHDILSKVENDVAKQLTNVSVKGRLTGKIVDGRVKVDQGVVAGCSGGTYENIAVMAKMLESGSIGNGPFSLSVYPASQPVNIELNRNGYINKLMEAGVITRTAFCGPCFGAGDVPANNGFSIRHTTRNFPNREGSKPGEGQIAWVGLMDTRSIAATALNGGILTPATEIDIPEVDPGYHFDKGIYEKRVYAGYGKPDPQKELKYGPNIKDWPQMISLPDNLLLQIASVIDDPVTTTDELIPSGETSSYRSNPIRLAEFTLYRKDPGYVNRAKKIQGIEKLRLRALEDGNLDMDELKNLYNLVNPEINYRDWVKKTSFGSVIYANKPGDGSAREQAASCQKVLGGWANIALEYATKRYRSNVINWGMVPFTIDADEKDKIKKEAYLYLPQIRQKLADGNESITGYIIDGAHRVDIKLKIKNLSPDQRQVILDGCLINYYRKSRTE
ncbi:hydratase [Halothermothrix orenii]|uniref:Aconitate hydratase n=1 Tax=Halothermothrix orenii (strain H 168 / OCM 544 / DSM 9562) TaxID=373903 RepID=B8CZZ8_HALOH|nr:hydratase [Halothermothrix orenii]ACL70850.1 aconitate hydratase [Halothermothrix orenii H 168]